MAEIAIYAALKSLTNALACEIVRRGLSRSCIIGSSGLEASMNNINRELRLMQELINHIDIHDQSNENQITWVNEVCKLANEIEDIMAEFVYLVGNSTKYGLYVKKLFSDPKSLFAFKRVVSQLQNAERSIKDLADSRERWVPTANNSKIIRNSILSNEHSHNIITVSAHFIDEDNVVGIEENRAKLTSWFNSEEQQLSIISVWGMGGVGKTTLVTNIFRRERSHFYCNAWITISHNYTVENILRSLISEIYKNAQKAPIDTANKNMKELKDTVRNLLEDKNYLIVLDDMWNPSAFHDIRDVLIDNHQGSRIIITSRDLKVASLAPENNRLELKPLLERESWDLFCRKAFPFERDHNCPASVEKLARKIVGKCDGLPLALISLGNMLSLFEQIEEEWKRVLYQLTWELDNNPDLGHLKNILNLSFKYLPRYLKKCFLYCSLFPEDFPLARKKLTRLWIAEGFIEEKGRSTLEEIAEGYLKDLIYRNMLQVVERNNFGRVKRCRMHDILRELAISLCTKENFGKLYVDNNPANINAFARRISIIKLTEEPESGASLPLLRTLTVFEPTVCTSLWMSMIFEKSRCIAVLNFEGLDIETIPNAIGDLFNLRYLSLRNTMVKLLPNSIKKLQNLQTLDLFASKIKKLPSGIEKLKKLRHLFAEVEINDPTYMSFQCRRGINLSKGMFYLKDLQTIQAVESNDMVVRELRNLTQLRTLRILNVNEAHSIELCRSLSNMSSLTYLSIHASNENEILHLEGMKLTQIQKLTLNGRVNEKMLESPSFQNTGDGIQNLYLRWSQLQNNPLPFLSCCKNITTLKLHRAYDGCQLNFQSGWFAKLKRLELGQMPNLTQLEMEQGSMVSLEEIILWELEQLVNIPKGIEHLVSLKWMGCSDMPAFVGGRAKGTYRLFHFTCTIF